MKEESSFHLADMHKGLRKLKKIFTWGSSIKFMAAINLGSENTSIGIGGGPTPLSCTLSPQKG